MIKELESCRPHTMIFDKLQNMFPTVSIDAPCSSVSIFDSVNVIHLLLRP